MSEHEDRDESPSQYEHISSCIKAIDDYRGQNISKWEAITQISNALQSTTASTDSEQRTTAGGTYLAMLDEHDQMLAGAGSRGRQRLNYTAGENEEHQEEFVGEDGNKR